MNAFTLLDLFSGISWGVVYITSIKKGIYSEVYCIPAFSICWNITWEMWIVIIGILNDRYSLPLYIQAVCFLLDIGIVATLLVFGDKRWAIILIGMLALGYWILYRGDHFLVTAFLDNVLMSALFVVRHFRDDSDWESPWIAWAKLVGTLCATVVYGILIRNYLVLWLGGLCLILDMYYVTLQNAGQERIWVSTKIKNRGGNKKMKKNRGFTLVELVVVIAILGVLAGVAVPVYSGYVKKAHQAADNQLLGAVNTAFAAACIENNVDFNSIRTGKASLDYTEKGPITGVATMEALSGDNLNTFKGDFLKYYGANNETALQYYVPGDISFYAGLGFLGASSLRTATLRTSGGQTVTLTAPQEVIDKINNSVWPSDEVGVENLLGSVDNVTGLVAALFGSTQVQQSLTPVLTGDEFVAYAITALDGGEGAMAMQFKRLVQDAMRANSGLTETEAKSTVVKMLVPQMLSGVGGEQGKQMLANAMVLYTAANSQQLATSGWYDTFKTTGEAINTEKVQSVLNGEAADSSTFAELACAYAMGIAYDGYRAQAEKAGATAMTKTDYLKSDQGQADFQAYLSCMDMISSNCDNADMTVEVLSKGFSGEGLLNAINALLGSKK